MPEHDAVTKTVEGNLDKQIKLTKRQYRFIEAYLTPSSETFANAFKSALAAGFSKSYARIITNNSLGLEWVQEAKKNLSTYEPEHIYRGFQDIAQHGAQDRDRLKALELMGKAQGMFIDRVQQQVEVKFVNDVPRPENEREVIDAE